MAEEEVKEEESGSQGKKSNLLMIIIIIVLVLIIILGAVAFLFIGDDEPTVSSTPMQQEKTKKVTKKSSGYNLEDDTRALNEIGILYPLDTFTVNLKSDSGRRFLKTTISLELEGEELSLELDAKSAVLRDRIIRILSSKTLEEVSSKKGKNKLSMQIMDTLNSMITDGRIKGIYFTEFVIQ
ncbi:flagellar basal body-associated protein FliL [Sulfurimonas sp. C5]|uniref:flagellar basal body-associated protein FliL n=1 Tax=Sulfurimonas sp. C5 TaxID=3036947 RepID=UPI0024580223|nr:flagellar basal body-associated protein FliL [Sulfurimonas sp. C5]MDH4944238.1 flagellar basal body-associated protein FliL [Sulfurimonas sp. C5]